MRFLGFVLSFFVFILALIPSTGSAQSMQCIELKEGSVNEVELRSADGHMNCFYLESGATLKQVNFLSKAIGAFGHKISLISIDPSNVSSELSSHESNAAGIASAAIQVTGRKIAFGILPMSGLTTNKHLSVSYFRTDVYGVVLADISDLPVPAPSGGGGKPKEPCRKLANGGCVYLSLPNNPAQEQAASSSSSTPTQCSASASIPAGKHPDFDIDKNLAELTARQITT